MKFNGVLSVVFAVICLESASSQCSTHQSLTFSRWSGVVPDRYTPVFVYSASGDESSLTGACLSRCRELEDCSAVVVAYGRGSCQGVAPAVDKQLKIDSDFSYFEKICMKLPEQCKSRWWVMETTPGYHLSTDAPNVKVLLNTTVKQCYAEILNADSQDVRYRSAQWVGQENTFDPELIRASEVVVGSCLLYQEDKFTEPESYRVANYQTFYLENQCRHDYSKKIDRCSYEEYYNQTLKHVEYSVTNYTKIECKSLCEKEERFVCRGFSWSAPQGRAPIEDRGVCDLHSEDLVTTGSWLLRKSSYATYYRRVICLNITVNCEESNIVVTYKPRSLFRGRVYVPGRGEQCSARSINDVVTLRLPLYGECDVNFAHAITNGPSGVVNRTMAYVLVMIQNNPIIQTAGDRWVRVGCSPGAKTTGNHVNTTIAVNDAGKPSSTDQSAPVNPPSASAVLNPGPDAASLSMYVVRVDGDAPGRDPAVALGEPLELRIETNDEKEIEAYHLVASSRLGDSSVLLLDSRGCPTGQVDFPQFTRSWLGGTQRLSARFKAFRFPTSHIVRFSLMVRNCENKCLQVNCGQANRAARNTNDTLSDGVPAYISEDSGWANQGRGVVAQGAMGCSGGGNVPLEVEMVVGSKDILSADNLVRADHRSNELEEDHSWDSSVVCIHEVLLVALALGWLTVQVLLLLGCCVLVKRYRNLAEENMQKDYHSFDNVGFDTISTHRRVHWPDQSVEILHAH